MRIQVIGRGRMGTALMRVLTSAATSDDELELLPPGGRGATGVAPGGRTADVVLLAVPDAEIGVAAACIAPGPLIGHLSGASPLDVLGSRGGFSLHPLLSVTAETTSFRGAYAAVDGTTNDACEEARDLAERIGLEPFHVAAEDRVAYHAAASIAANFLVTIEGFAEQLADRVGVPRAALYPLASAALGNWARDGASRALTGPIVRGDRETVRQQREAIADRMPERLALFDELVAATEELAEGQG